MIVLSNFIACPPHHPSGWVRLSSPEVRRRQVEVQAGDEAHEDPHDDARFGAEHEGVGEAEDLGPHGSKARPRAVLDQISPLAGGPGRASERMLC